MDHLFFLSARDMRRKILLTHSAIAKHGLVSSDGRGGSDCNMVLQLFCEVQKRGKKFACRKREAAATAAAAAATSRQHSLTAGGHLNNVARKK